MTKTNKTAIQYFILAILCGYFACNSAHSQKPSKPNPPSVTDTIPTYIIRVPVLELKRSIDSLNIVVSYCGKTLSVDQADQVKELYNRTLSRLLKNISIDSTTVPKIKK